MKCNQPLSWRNGEVEETCPIPGSYETMDGQVLCVEHARLCWGSLTAEAKRRWLAENGRLHEETWNGD